MKFRLQLLSAVLSGWAGLVAWGAQPTAPGAIELPPAATHAPDFARDIKPLFETSCLSCHAHGQKKGKLAIDSRAQLLEGGASGPALVPGRSAESLLVQLVAGQDPDRLMPAKGAPWTPEQIGLLRAWIDQGALWPEGLVLARGMQAPLEPRRVELPEGGSPPANPVDRLLGGYFAKHDIQPPKPVDDALFARRVYLDVIGMLPTPAELRSFERDPSPNKRPTLVKRVLAMNQRYAEHWMTFWNDCLRNDYRGAGYIDGGRKQITPWLYSALATNLPFDRFVSSLVNPDEHSEGFAKGIVWRGAINASQTPPMQAAQNVSQVFLGINLKCASCHDSFINNWKLSDAYGLASVYADGPLELVRCDTPTGVTAERRFLFPQLGPLVDSTNRADRLASLASVLTSPQNGRLTRTVVNRIWAQLFGRGIIEPVDEMDNPPWHPDLLDWLANDLAAHGYDLKHTMERILTSHAYQLPSVPGEERLSDAFVFRGPVVKRLSAEQYCDALSSLTGVWRELPANLEIDFTAGTGSAAAAAPSARWIWSTPKSAEGDAPGTRYFRKNFQLSALPAAAHVLASADNRFRLYVNGREAGAGDDWHKVRLFNIRQHLVIGDNALAVEATNDRTNADNPEDDSPNPAGLLLALRIANDDSPSALLSPTVVSDSSWRYATDKVNGWKDRAFDSERWPAAAELGSADTAPWKLGRHFAAIWSSAAQYGRVRAVHAAADPLTMALGRPNREQVTTTRLTTATTLQALELTNGSTLAEWLGRAAEHVLAETDATAPGRLIRRLYRQGLGRPPTNDELRVARELVGRPLQREGVEDLLWAISLLPEFQLIR